MNLIELLPIFGSDSLLDAYWQESIEEALREEGEESEERHLLMDQHGFQLWNFIWHFLNRRRVRCRRFWRRECSVSNSGVSLSNRR